MAGLEGLASIIYHEKQQSGSMLCAQHALNSLLQGPYFTAPDLSEIARKLDRLEEQYNTDSQRGDGDSKNMDDTGFFSVQVMEEALGVWGLSLVRWRSSAMRPYQDRPHTQLAFILNMGEHWFTLRRFGPASANINDDPGEGHWFNLNSFLSAPGWVGKLYLGMVLQQAETEGYSVFAVIQSDSSQPLALSRTGADDVAATLPEPQSAILSGIPNATSHVRDTSRSTTSTSGSVSQLQRSENTSHVEGVEDEDYELQAALQASLESQEGYGLPFHDDGKFSPPVVPTFVPASSSSQTYPNVASGSTSGGANSYSSQQFHQHGHADSDPVTASMERNRVLLQRMREQQELAQRELWSLNEADPEQQAIQDARRQARLREEEEEAKQLKKAIEESEAMAREWDERQRGSPQQAQTSSLPSISRNDDVLMPSIDHSLLEHRNYDDEDAELQAALRASLQNVPSGWQQPEIPPPPQPKHLESQAPTAHYDPMVNNKRAPKGANMDEDEDEVWRSESEDSEDGASSGNTGSSAAEKSVPPSLDEIRQARLARFGS